MPIDNAALAKVFPIYEEAHMNEAYLCKIQSQNEFCADLVDECAIPDYSGTPLRRTPLGKQLVSFI